MTAGAAMFEGLLFASHLQSDGQAKTGRLNISIISKMKCFKSGRLSKEFDFTVMVLKAHGMCLIMTNCKYQNFCFIMDTLLIALLSF